MDWAIRDPKEEDVSFLYATWLRSYYSDNEFAYHVNNEPRNIVRKSIYFESYRIVVDSILLTASINVACLPTDESVILGYMVFEPNLLHYCFTKDAFRGLGIARSLYNKSFGETQTLECTHLTKRLQPFIRRNQHITFNPYKLYKGM